jgi:hypothetical protein
LFLIKFIEEKTLSTPAVATGNTSTSFSSLYNLQIQNKSINKIYWIRANSIGIEGVLNFGSTWMNGSDFKTAEYWRVSNSRRWDSFVALPFWSSCWLSRALGDTRQEQAKGWRRTRRAEDRRYVRTTAGIPSPPSLLLGFYRFCSEFVGES